MVGMAADAVSAARMAIRIFRENIFSGERFENLTNERSGMASDGENGAKLLTRSRPGKQGVSLGIYQRVGYFPVKPSCIPLHERTRWLSGRTTFCARASSPVSSARRRSQCG